MIHHVYSMGFYWGSRVANITDSTELIIKTLADIGHIREDWREWYWVNGSKKSWIHFCSMWGLRLR